MDNRWSPWALTLGALLMLGAILVEDWERRRWARDHDGHPKRFYFVTLPNGLRLLAVAAFFYAVIA